MTMKTALMIIAVVTTLGTIGLIIFNITTH